MTCARRRWVACAVEKCPRGLWRERPAARESVSPSRVASGKPWPRPPAEDRRSLGAAGLRCSGRRQRWYRGRGGGETDSHRGHSAGPGAACVFSIFGTHTSASASASAFDTSAAAVIPLQPAMATALVAEQAAYAEAHALPAAFTIMLTAVIAHRPRDVGAFVAAEAAKLAADARYEPAVVSRVLLQQRRRRRRDRATSARAPRRSSLWTDGS